MASQSIPNSIPLYPKPSSGSHGRVRIIAKIRAFTDSENLSSNPWISVHKPDGNCSDEGVTISFADQTNSRKDGYKLDYSYGQDEDVEQIFSREIKPFLPGVFNGLNTSILAYGARGSGKSYMIQGSEEKPGLVSLAMAEILSSSEENRSSIAVSCFEVYQDHIYDLLEPNGQEVVVLDDAEGRIRIKGLSQVSVKSVSEFHKVYYHGCVPHKPVQKITNEAPYRSHKGLIIHVSCNSNTGACIVAKMNFVDLAGYEDTKRKSNTSFASNITESAWINKSLYTLQNVVKALNSDERVPFRENKLTRMLQDSLGGKNQTLMVTCLNPIYCQDTMHTLSLASRSCQVVNQDSTRKGKNAVKPMAGPSPKGGKPQSIPTSMKKDTISQSSAVKKRKLFEGANPIPSSAQAVNQDSTKKTKNAVRPMPVPSPKVGTPQFVLTSLKNHTATQLKTMQKKTDDASSPLKRRKLFDGANPVPGSMQVTTEGHSLKDSSSNGQAPHWKENPLYVNLDVRVFKAPEEEIVQTSVVKDIETATKIQEQHHLESTIDAEYYEVIIPKEEISLEMENTKPFVNDAGSSPFNKKEVQKEQHHLESTVGTEYNEKVIIPKEESYLEKQNSDGNETGSSLFNKKEIQEQHHCEIIIGSECSENVTVLEEESNIETENTKPLVNESGSSPFNEKEIQKEQHHLERIIATECYEKGIIQDESNLEKENTKPSVNKNGSSPFSSRLSNSSKSVCFSTPLKVEMAKKNDSLEYQGGSNTVELKTPKCESKRGLINHMDVSNSCTPRGTYSARSSRIKESLVQEFLNFVNTASKEELKQLKGVGEKRANYIMELREDSPEPFKKLDDLQDVGLTTKQIKGMIAMDLFM